MTDVTDDLDTYVDLEDDVEGHGLREVAAGLGAAAVLVGGAAAATQLGTTSTTGSGGGPLPGVVQTVQQTVGGQTADHGVGYVVLEQAESTADRAVEAVQDLPPAT